MNRPYAAKLQELLEASYNLPNAVCDLGRVELGPLELEDITKRLFNREKSGIDAKAHYLLASSGFNAEMVLSEIANLRFRDLGGDQQQLGASAAKSTAKLGAKVGSGDSMGLQQIAGNLGTSYGYDSSSKSSSASTQQHDSTLGTASATTGSLAAGSALQDTHKSLTASDSMDVDSFDIAQHDPVVAQNSKEFDEFVDKHIKVDWASRKREVLNLLGRKPTKLRSAPGPSGSSSEEYHSHSSSSVLGPQSTNTDFTPIMASYAQVITNFCDHEFEVPTILSKFSEVAQHADSHEPHIVDSWRALETKDARTFLEKQFWEHINFEIANNRQNAKLGGTPSAFSKVKAYVRLKYYHNGQWDSHITVVNQTPIWAYIYYLVRAGFIEDALKLVLERTDIFSTIGSTFATFFKAWAESPTNSLPRNYVEMIQSEYHQLFRPGRAFDPYRQALWKIIGRCELYKRSLPQVAVTTEDWLWLQLVLCRDASDPASVAYPGSTYTLDDLKAYILEIGPSHLASEPTKYFLILGLLGLWTEAVSFLRPHAEVHAVHFAIALAASKNKDFKGDLVSLIGHYTRFFRQNMPTLAVDYLTLISLSPQTKFVDTQLDKSKESGTASQLAAREGLRELVLETRRFSELLGDVEVFTEQGMSGSIESRMSLVGLNDRAQYRYSIAERAAETANKQGYTLDAILLYRLARDYTHVFALVNSHLGLLISSISVGVRVEDSLDSSNAFLQLARNVIRIDSDTNSGASNRDLEKARKTCRNLLTIADCLDLVAKHDYESCLNRISDTGLLILSPTPAFEEVRTVSREFSTYDESLACNIPKLLLVAMTCIVRINEQLRQQNPGDSTIKDRVFEQNRGKANNCMVYAGLIQFRMPREVYVKLTQLDDAL